MTSYTRQNPFLATIKERYTLNRVDSTKRTVHLIIDLKDSGIRYKAGDCVGIYPSNSPETVQSICGARSGALITCPRTGERMPFERFLSQKANLSRVTKKLAALVGEQQSDLHVEDFLEGRHHHITPQELADSLAPLLPRFYSIASSQKVVGDEIHLTVATVSYTENGKNRAGVCSSFLCDRAPLQDPVIPLFLHPATHFALPNDDAAPMIMVGAGTGIAPYRGFMQERRVRGSSGKNWLIFGEWRRAHDYYYENDWESLQREGLLRMELAFSRDQAHKVYVQHKLLESGREIWDWLQQGAHFYVCGDASRMAKEVDAALHEIVRQHGSLDLDAKAYVKALRKEKRYLRDVY